MTAADYHAALFAQADEQAEKLAVKVEKLEAQLAAARDAHEAAVAAAVLLRQDPPVWVEPTEHVIARVGG
ncbi:MAG: hypothetical protein AB7W59_02165 [Acidimicrobiia bacterium]